VDFYFGDSNYPKDQFLQREAAKDPEGYVPIASIATFNRLKALTTDFGLIAESLRDSEVVTLSEDHKKLKRKHPLPDSDTTQLRTITIQPFPQGTTIEQLDEFLAPYGKVSCVRFRKLWTKPAPKDETSQEKGNAIDTENKEQTEKGNSIDSENKEQTEKGNSIDSENKEQTSQQMEIDNEKNQKLLAIVELTTEEEANRVLATQLSFVNTPLVMRKYVDKKQLRESKKNQRNDPKQKGKRKEPVFTSGKIITLTIPGVNALDEANKLSQKNIEVMCAPFGSIAFIDYKGGPTAYVRFEGTESAQKALQEIPQKNIVIGEQPVTVSLLEGENEKQYYEQNIFRRPNKTSNKRTRKNK